MASSRVSTMSLSISFFYFFLKDVEHFKSLYFEFVNNIASFFFFFLMFWIFGPEACGILVSLIRDRTHDPCLERCILDHCTARRISSVSSLKVRDNCPDVPHLRITAQNYSVISSLGVSLFLFLPIQTSFFQSPTQGSLVL